MLVDIACDSVSLGEASASNSRRTDMGSSDLASDTDVAGAASGKYVGCRDVESLTPLHQILPYGSQLRDTTSSAGRACVNADIRKDLQVSEAVAQIEATIRRHPETQPLVLSAYSDGSVAGRSVASSAAIAIKTTDGEVVATVRLAPTDIALSSGRTEWVGLVMVLVAWSWLRSRATRRALSCDWTTSRSPTRLTTGLAQTHGPRRGVTGVVPCGGA